MKWVYTYTAPTLQKLKITVRPFLQLVLVHVALIKGRFLEFRRYHNFANLFSKLSKTVFTKKLVSFSKKYKVNSIRLAVLRGIP